MIKRRNIKSKKVATKPSFYEEEEEEVEVQSSVQVKSRASFIKKKNRNILNRNEGGSAGGERVVTEERQSIYTKSLLEELKKDTYTNELIESDPVDDQFKKGTDVIMLDDDDDDGDDELNEELKEERLMLNDLDLDEGAGFEDDELPIGINNQLKEEQRRRQGIVDAINELSESEVDSDDSEDAGWELKQRIAGGAGGAGGKGSMENISNRIPEITELINFDDAFKFIDKKLNDLVGKRKDVTAQLDGLEKELNNLNERKIDIQENVDKVGRELEEEMIL